MAKVHLIGNAHLDPVWLWRWQEGYAEVLATFRSALDRMKEFDTFVFTCAGAAYYAWVEETDPAMFEEIRRRISEGRWVIVGGWWIQPDCNAPCGESFARHALYAQRYFQSRFGRRAEIAYNVDSFGHNAMLPQILRLSGMRGYVMMRPNGREEKRYPFDGYAFLWESPDGSRIPAFRIPESYGSSPFERVAEKARADLERAERLGTPIQCFYGVGNHGGGPTVENLRALLPLTAEHPESFAFSSPNAYFDELDEGRLPALRDDLLHHASGCYTAVMEVKRLNRLAESRLLAAEKYAELARGAGLSLPQEALEPAWRNVLFNQFHDILGGCSLRAAYEDARESFGESLNAAARATNRALQALAWNIDTSQGLPVRNNKHDFRLWEQENRGVPVTVFNPHSFAALLPVRTGVQVASVADEAGQAVPSQRLRGPVTNGREDKWETAFLAEVPPLGWRTYWLYQKPHPQGTAPRRRLEASPDRLENDWLALRLDPQSGRIRSLYDKAAGRQLLAGETAALVIDETACDTWAHGVFAFRQVVGRFEGSQPTLMECGDVQATIHVVGRYESSVLEQRITLYRDRPGLFLEYRVQWNQRHRMLKLDFPTPWKDGRVIASIPYGHWERPADGKEQPMQGWVLLQADGYGLGIATDSRSAYDALEGDLRITALRSPLYADHYGDRDAYAEFTEQGEQRFSLMLAPVDGDVAPLADAAAQLGTPVERIVGTYHKGSLPAVGQALRVSAPNVCVTVLKASEEGEGLVLRCHETAGRACEARIELPLHGYAWTAAFGPQQIRSFLLREGKAVPVNLLEEPLTT